MLEKDSIIMMQMFFWGLSAITGITAAWFTMRGTGQTSLEKEETQKKYRQRWQQIRDLNFLQLPEQLILGALAWERSLPSKLSKILDWLFDISVNMIIIFAFIAIIIIPSIGFQYVFNNYFLSISLALLGTFLIFLRAAVEDGISQKLTRKNSFSSHYFSL